MVSKTRRSKRRGGAKHRPTKTKRINRPLGTNRPLFVPPTFGPKSNNNIFMQLNQPQAQQARRNGPLPITRRKKARRPTEPDQYLRDTQQFLETLTADFETFTPEEFERHSYLALIIQDNTRETIRDLGRTEDVDPEKDPLDYVEELTSLIDDFLDEYDDVASSINLNNVNRKFELQQEMMLLATAIDEAIMEGKQGYKKYIKRNNSQKNNSAMNNLVSATKTMALNRTDVDELADMLFAIPKFR